MPQKPAIGYGDVIAASTTLVTASSERDTLPALYLKHPHVARPWRTLEVASAWVLADFGATQSIGWTALAGLNLTAVSTVRVRLSTVDATGEAGDAYDSGVLDPSGVTPAYRLFAHLLPGSPSGRYLRVDLADAALSYIEAGRWWAGTLLQPERSYTYGNRRHARDLGERNLSEGGQAWVTDRGKYRGFTLEFPSFTKEENDEHLEQIQLQHGLGDDIMLMRNPDSTNLGRDTVVGILESAQDVSNPHFQRYTLALTVYERL
jgi:hypothetical protein